MKIKLTVDDSLKIGKSANILANNLLEMPGWFYAEDNLTSFKEWMNDEIIPYFEELTEFMKDEN